MQLAGLVATINDIGDVVITAAASGQMLRFNGASRVNEDNFAAWEQNEPYTIALLIKGRSGGASTKHLYRSGTSSTADHILFLTSGTTPNLRHQASGGGTVTLTSSGVAAVVTRVARTPKVGVGLSLPRYRPPGITALA